MLLAAHEAKFGPAYDPMRALANAGRRAARLFPLLPLGEGLRAWADQILNEQPTPRAASDAVTSASSLSADLLMDLAIGDCECVVCASPRGVERPELPLRSKVCDACWPVVAAELAEGCDHEAREGMLA
ncbi:hypothetical protein KL864_35430 [Mycolicibacterium goodii]|uniref:hypothetical protein n=1 Tax=Mycolicibacterium goodii TaxID=134601 RepID=UPI001BDCDE29|nr:hypothetical protein [Mycolicibacterium goodii]MBU8821147.1 hypothetical protein [Mycolicibacterium goodii]